MPMTLESLHHEVERGVIDTVIVGFVDLYGRLMGKRIDARFFLDDVVATGAHACDYMLTVDIEMSVVDGYEFASWSRGYGDVQLVIDLATLRRTGWDERSAVVFCDLTDESTHADIAVAPRQILRRQIDRLADRGLSLRVASELEFYLYIDSFRAASRADYRHLTAAGWYSEDYDLLQGGRHEPYLSAVRRMLNNSGIPVESTKGETGVGQHEINIRHAETLEMADRHTLIKHGMKALADQHDRSVTFMAKPSTDDAGSGCHLHLSLWDTATNTNVFVGDGGQPSDQFRWFLGGWMALLDDFMVCYAPTVNSYKRFADESWAPTRVTWATDNRTAAFRVVGADSSLRIECRVPGADCNPYLAYAAAIASGLAGIDGQIDPPDPVDGDAYRASRARQIPADLVAAIDNFRSSDAVDSAFGAGVVEHYTHFFTTEVAAARTAVTDWERQRYFERI